MVSSEVDREAVPRCGPVVGARIPYICEKRTARVQRNVGAPVIGLKVDCARRKPGSYARFETGGGSLLERWTRSRGGVIIGQVQSQCLKEGHGCVVPKSDASAVESRMRCPKTTR